MNSNNPVFRGNTFARAESGETMTVNGTVTRALILLVLLFGAALFTWDKFNGYDHEGALAWAIGGMVGGLVLCLVTCFAQRASPVTAPLYAICEGLLLGAVSAYYEARFHGLVLNAVLLTGGVFFTMLAAYRTGLLRATPNFIRGVFAATAAIAIVYLVGWIMSLFGKDIPYIHQSGTFGIVFSLAVVVVAALNFIIDFAVIEEGAQQGAPKYMEWYGAFALLVTLVWLYLEILRLLAKLRGRD